MNNEEITNYYPKLHLLFNSLKRINYPYEGVTNFIPNNGIYIMFERNERFNNLDRIVRIGTHNKDKGLILRLNEHYLKANKDRSIFRKNIGRCFINIENKDYLKIWDKDSTSKEDKIKNVKIKDFDYELYIEDKISKYIQNNISFVTIEIDDLKSRVFWEKKLISTIAQYNNVTISENWLGKKSPKEKIRKYGLWQVNNLMNKTISSYEYKELLKLVKI